MPEQRPSKTPLLVGSAASLLLLLIFFYLRDHGWKGMELSTAWLCISVVPILVGLVIGGYVKGLKGPGGMEIEFTAEVPSLPRVLSPRDVALPLEGSEDTAEPSEAKKVLIESYDKLMDIVKVNRKLFLVHAYKKSVELDNEYDVSIFLMRHVPGKGNPNQVTGFTNVEKVEFYFGQNWEEANVSTNFMYTVPYQEGRIGISVTVWGSFLAVCRVTFTAREPGGTPETAILTRYIDFAMLPSINVGTPVASK